MDELALSISAAAGLDPDVARKAAGIVLDFIQKSLPAAEASAIIDRIPGGREAASAAAEDEAEGGGSSARDLAGLASRLEAEGVLPGDIERVLRAVLAGLRTAVGTEAVAAVGRAMPELAPFM